MLHSGELKKSVRHVAMKTKIDAAYRLELKKSTHQESRILKTDAPDSWKLVDVVPRQLSVWEFIHT